MKECPACSRCFPDSVNHCPTDGERLRTTIQGDTVLDERYQLERRLGQGGMGVVYKARHIFLKTQHAIKVILPDLVGNDPTLATRFRQEAMAAAAIRHQNTVSVTDFGVIDRTTPFLVMEFIEGRSLHDLIQTEGRLPPSLALEVVLAISEGIAEAHRQGIIHRDIKPLNVVLKGGCPVSEAVKVLDFGLAKIKSGELLGSFVAAQTQGMMGSPLYMAPEQWGDEEPDARADIYSLGIILFQLLAGDVPFKGNSVPSIMNKHLTAEPPTLAERGVSVPTEVEQVVRRALEKDPARRPQTVEEFIEGLRAALSSVNAAAPTIVAVGNNLGAQTVAITPGDNTGGKAGAVEPAPQPEAAGQATRPQPDEIRTDDSHNAEAAPPPRPAETTPLSTVPLPSVAGHPTRQPPVEQPPLPATGQPPSPQDDAAFNPAVTRRMDLGEAAAAPQAETDELRGAEGPGDLGRREEQAPSAAPTVVVEQAAQAQADAAQAQPAAERAAHDPGGATARPAPSTFDVARPAQERGPLLVLAALLLVALVSGAALVAYLLSQRAGQENRNGVADNTSASPSATPTPTPAPAPAGADLIALPGGTFRIGRDDVPANLDSLSPTARLWFYIQWPAREVPVRPFRIDRTEVTNGEYAEFVKATGHKPPPEVWDGDRPRAGEERLPVRNVTLADARAFAAWRSRRDGAAYRLPTEDEWEYAARGAGATRLYPWGEEWAEGRANLASLTPKAVGAHPSGATPQGVQDMIGNVWEWTTTEAAMYKGNDRTVLDSRDRGKVVIRGGAFESKPGGDTAVTATSRLFVAKDGRYPVLGFRLVSDGR